MALIHNVRTLTNDNISIPDSTDTGYDEDVDKVKLGEAIRLAFKQWRYMAKINRCAWNKRADRLNKRKLPGWIVKMPSKILNAEVVMKSLSLEWEGIVKVLKEAIERKPKNDKILKVYSLSYYHKLTSLFE